MKSNHPQVVIVGTGALGCLFAARLAASGLDVGMLGSWPEGLAALQQNGVTLVSGEESNCYPVRASGGAADFAGAKLALVLVKAWQTGRAAAQLAHCLAGDGLVVTLQNGLGNREKLETTLGADRVAAGVVTTGATLQGPGQVLWGGEGRVSLGAHPRLGMFPDLLAAAGFAVEVVKDVDSLAWSKLVINAAINPLTALLGVSNGELFKLPTAGELSRQLAAEVAAVAGARGVALSMDDPAGTAEDVARRTAGNLSSMLQDVQRGAPTEIDAICGAVVRAGRKAGVPTPVNETMWKLVQAKSANSEV